jgi:YqaJ-like viral recombinase domain
MTLHIFDQLEQGSDEWMDARRGLLTASSIGQLITTKTIKPANNDYSRGLTLTLVAERITGITEPVYITADMERGNIDEGIARDHYSEHVAPVIECGFMILECDGTKLGYSPDGLVSDDGLVEFKSRKSKTQIATVLADEIPPANLAQCMAGLYVSGRDWIDYVSWCGGLPMYRKRVHPDQQWFDVIAEVVTTFEQNAADMINRYTTATAGLPPTERIDHAAIRDIQL